MTVDLLATARVAHLATVDADGRPHVIPICFAWVPPILYSAIDGKPKRRTTLRRLRNIVDTGRAAVVVDSWNEDWSKLAYVLVEGAATILTDGIERDEALLLLTAKYPQYDDLPLVDNIVIRLTTDRQVAWSGAGRTDAPSGRT
ncbi:MAG: TIGR03668 family PPOX class F420-dependent oxidoreductase [Candidatus Limnocylindrales bacterium]